MRSTRRGFVTSSGFALAAMASGVEAAAPQTAAEAANLKLVRDYLATWANPHFDPDKVMATYFSPDARIRLTDTIPVSIGPVAGAASFRPYIADGQRFDVRYLDV